MSIEGASMPSTEEIGWAITTVAKRERAMWRFRLILLAVVLATSGVAIAATELRMEELFWLDAAVAPLGLAAAVGVLLRGPGSADVARAWTVLREATEAAKAP